MKNIQISDKPITLKHRCEAESKELEIISETSNPNYGYFRLRCGHFQFLHFSGIRQSTSSSFFCNECHIDKLKNEADLNSLSFIRLIRNNYAEYKLPCSHTKEMSTYTARYHKWRCKECQENLYTEQARAVGLELQRFTYTKNSDYRVYKLQCGCFKEIKTESVRKNTFECKIHHDRSIDKNRSTFVYLVKLKLDTPVLKVGYAFDVESRIRRYGLNFDVDIIRKIPFDSFETAYTHEKQLHCKWKHSSIDPDFLRQFMSNGFTECYPVELIDSLIEDLDLIKEGLNG